MKILHFDKLLVMRTISNQLLKVHAKDLFIICHYFPMQKRLKID